MEPEDTPSEGAGGAPGAEEPQCLHAEAFATLCPLPTQAHLKSETPPNPDWVPFPERPARGPGPTWDGGWVPRSGADSNTLSPTPLQGSLCRRRQSRARVWLALSRAGWGAGVALAGTQAGRCPARVPLPGRVLPAMWAGRPAPGLPHGAPRRPAPGGKGPPAGQTPSTPGRAWPLRGLHTRARRGPAARPRGSRAWGGGGACTPLRQPVREGRWAQTRAAPATAQLPGARRAEAA